MKLERYLPGRKVLFFFCVLWKPQSVALFPCFPRLTPGQGCVWESSALPEASGQIASLKNLYLFQQFGRVACSMVAAKCGLLFYQGFGWDSKWQQHFHDLIL